MNTQAATLEPPAQSPAGSVLSAQEIDYSVNGRAILHRVSAAFSPGQFSVIIGPNGAGKSTLVSLLAGDSKPQSGHAELLGRDVASWSPKEAARRRAVMGQHTAVSFPFPARDVIAMGRTPWRGTDEARHNEQAVAYAAEAAEVEHLLERSVTVLSGGERQRIALARALAQRRWEPSTEHPAVLMLDEPVSALDIRHQERTLQLLRSLANDGACIVTVLHDLDAAAAYADRLIVMDEGQIVADGDIARVCDEDLLSSVYRTPITVLTGSEGQLLRVGPRR